MIFSKLPIRRKLLLAFFATTGTALLVCFGGLLIEEHSSLRTNLSREASSLADTIAITSTAALSFNDEKACGEILLSLKAHPHVDAAALFDKNGNEAARFVRNGHDQIYFDNKVSLYSDSRHIHVVRPVVIGSDTIGSLYLSYSLNVLNESIKLFALIAICVVFISFLISWFVALRLTRQIVSPLEELSSVADTISQTGDYSLRVQEQQSDDEIGALVRCINVMLDHTEMRDGQLLEHQEQLEMIVRERTDELQSANNSLKHEIAERIKSDETRLQVENELLKHRKLESIGILAGGIAHNFNNILTGIVGFISLAHSRSSQDPQVQSYLNKAEKACFRAKGLTQQMLTFAKGGDPICRPVLISDIIKEAVDITLAGSNVKCNFVESRLVLVAEADAGQMVQVFNNLLLNACQAMEQGGTIEIVTDMFAVTPESVLNLEQGDYVSITVSDHGDGILPENIQLIFDPYFTTKPSGSGLGLSTCYSIMKKHKGTITVASEPGNGTTFTLYLPLHVPGASSSVTHKDALQEASVVDSKKAELKILLMDDEETICDIAAEIVRDMGHDITCVRDGLEAIVQYRLALESGKKFDVVILDLTIPGGMGGKETCEKILEFDASASIVVSSGYANDTAMSNYAAYGFVKSIPKPYSYKELEQLVTSVRSNN